MEDGDSDETNGKSFDTKEDAMAYAKELAQTLKGGEAKEEPLNVTDDFIDSLKSQYKNVSKQTPEQEKELETTLDKLDKKQLKKLAFSDINVVSDIASKKWYKLSYPSDDEPKKDKSEPSTSDSIDNAYDAKDFKSTVKSLKGKVSDEDYNEIKDNLKALANLQYDLGDIDRDEDNEEWGMQKDTIDVEVDDLKGLITKAIDNQVDKNGVPLKAIDKDLDNSFDDKEEIDAYLNKKTKDSTQQRAGNTKVNKSVRNQAKKLGITPAKLGKEEYQKAMIGAAYEALTDSNFSTEARQLLAVITGDEKLAEKPDYPSMSDDDFDTKIAQIRKDREAGDVYTTPENDKASELGQHSSSESSWSGADAIDAIAFDLKMNGYKDLAAKIQSVIKED
jgi:predicted MPP superfamily phosphohydrolase